MTLPILGCIIPNMGRFPPVPSGLADALFSQVQQRVLALLLGHPERSFHVSEIIRLVESGSGSVQRELEKLTKAGIISVTASANRKLYQANRASAVFAELHSIVLKTMGLTEPLRKALTPFEKHIRWAFVYGSIAKGTDTSRSDIDLMIVGSKLSYSAVYAALQGAEARLLRQINPNIMTMGEWRKKRASPTSFLTKLLAQPKLFLIGSEDDIPGA